MEKKFLQFHSLLKDLDLYDQITPILSQNGFEDWETVSALTSEVLKEIGIDNETTIKKVLACVISADSIEVEEEKQLNTNDNDNESEVNSVQTTKPDGNGNSITQAVLMKGTSMKKDRFESNEKFMGRLTHLSLNDRKLVKIENLQYCKKLQYLNLYNNDITKIEGLDNLTNLEQLHLERNRIKRIEGLTGVRKLKQLYLTNNKIQSVEGLEYLENLEELYVSEQRLQGKSMSFSLDSMAAVSGKLRVLEAESNNVVDPTPLSYLSELQKLKLQNNKIEKYEDLERLLACMTSLTELDLRQNPIEKTNKLRDQVFMMSRSLETFNEKQILSTEREFLLKLYNIKGARGRHSQTQSIIGKEQNTKDSKENLEITGAVLKTMDESFPTTFNKKNPILNSANEFYSNTVHALSKKGFTNLKR